MKRLIWIFLSLLLLSACAKEAEPPPETVPEPEPMEISVPEPEPPEEPAAETEADWAYAQAAAFIRDRLRSCGRDEEVTVYFAPWEPRATFLDDPEDAARWDADAAVEFPSGVLLWAPVSCAWNRENGFIDPFVDFHFLLHPDCTNYYSASCRQLAAAPETVLSTADLDVTPCYDPPEPPHHAYGWLEYGVVLSEPSQIPQPLIEEVRRCILTYDDPLEALRRLETGRTVPPEVIAQEAPRLSEDVSSRTGVDWDLCLAEPFTAVDFDNDGIEDRYLGYWAGMGRNALRLYLFCAGQPDGSFVADYYEESGSGYLWFLGWEGQTYCVSSVWDLYYDASMPPSEIILTRMEDGLAAEKAVFHIYLGRGVPAYDEDGRLLAPDFPPPSEREIDLEVYTRGMNTDFSLPNH